MNNRASTACSPQVSMMGVIDVSENDFSLKMPFCIKNDGDEAVTLEVNLWDMPDNEFIETTFDVGWNPEIVRVVKHNASVSNLKYGY